MSRHMINAGRSVMIRSNNAQLKYLQRHGLYTWVRTFAYGLRINRRRK